MVEWTLHNISCAIHLGEAVGVVGVNGEGKRTLLKVITDTIQPTNGRVVIQNRVAALLELGMSFHLDFTDRQNVLMASRRLGLQVKVASATCY